MMNSVRLLIFESLYDIRYFDYTLARSILLKGEAVVYPTDTIYGILGDAMNKYAYKVIYNIKGRDISKQFIILISSKDLVYSFWEYGFIRDRLDYINSWEPYTTYIGPVREDFYLKEFFPNGKVALRYTDVFWIKNLGNIPLIATSANLSGKEYLPSLKALRKLSGVSCIFYIKSGYKGMKPSKIIDLESFRVIRK